MKAKYILFLVSLLAVGCGPPDADGPVEVAAGQPAVGLEVGDLAPEIEGLDLNGQTMKLSDYRGQVVLLDFWGDW